jgi:hypothetical protein
MICTVEGCEKPAKRSNGKYFDRFCSMHRARVTRHGDPSVRLRTLQPFMHSNGYMQQRNPDHPLAMANGCVYVHRAVLYAAIGDSTHRCHWCEIEVRWCGETPHELVPDHLDDDRTNNNPANLVPSCRQCNTRRACVGRRADRKDLDLTQLFAWFDAGLTKTEIARRMGVSRWAVRQRLSERAA